MNTENNASFGATNIEISPKEYETILNWNDAIKYCQSLVIKDKSDWRLPTVDELQYIYDSENDFTNSYYWSSAPLNDNIAFSKSMINGSHHNDIKTRRIYVRPVRTI